MSTEETAAAAAEDPAIVELTTQIAALGTSIADAKKAKQPKKVPSLYCLSCDIVFHEV